MAWPVPEPLGPPYPELGAGVAKWRKVANKAGSIAAMARADVVAYADAIEKAIRAKHRTLHMRPTPSPSAGWYSPPSITRLLRYENPLPMAGDPHHDRTWAAREEAVYAAAMKAKHGARVLEAAE